MKKENNKSKLVIIIILLLLVLFSICFLVLKDKNIFTSEIDTKEVIKYNYTGGFLNRIVDESGKPKQNDFVIDGIILIGNRHSYVESEENTSTLSYFEEIGYLTKNINSSFYLNERIEMYVSTNYSGSNDDIKIFITPHKNVTKYESMSFEELINFALEKGSVVDYEHPDENHPTYISNPYVSSDLKPGKYDILFTYKENLAYLLTIDLSKEPTE